MSFNKLFTHRDLSKCVFHYKKQMLRADDCERKWGELFMMYMAQLRLAEHALYGGHVEAYRTVTELEHLPPGCKIRYFDVVSLYPRMS